MTKVPWYKKGLKFECTQCGNCCTGAPGFVWVNKAEIDAMAGELGIASVEEFENKYVRLVGNCVYERNHLADFLSYLTEIIEIQLS